MKKCSNCYIVLSKHQSRYCSVRCQYDYQHKLFIQEWRRGKTVVSKNISKHLKRYLSEKFNNKCSQCGWCKSHPLTGKPLLEVDHIDGDSGNNKEENLRLLCPNCHSLTSTYKNLNKGNGRKWRTSSPQPISSE